MNILLTHAASINNKGDAGIFSGMLSSLRKAFPKSYFFMTTIDSLEKNGAIFEEVELFHSFFYYGVFYRKGVFFRFLETVCIFIFVSSYLLLFPLLGKSAKKILPFRYRDLLNKYESANLVIPVGGGQLSARKGFKQTAVIMLHALEILIPQRLKKPIIIYPQSIGPFGNKFQEWCVRRVLKRVTTIFVREQRSFELLMSWGMSKDKILIVPDAGFLFSPNTKESALQLLQKYNLPNGRRLLGVTVREWLPAHEQENFEMELAHFLNYVTDRNFNVVIIPQVIAEEHEVDDRVTSRNVFNKIENKENITLITENIEPDLIKGVYENLDVLLGMRMHSNIFSLTGFVPVLAIAYEHKTNGIMEQLNIGQYVVNIKDVTELVLREKFEVLLRNREEYVEMLKLTVPRVVKDAEGVAFKLKSIYEGYSK